MIQLPLVDAPLALQCTPTEEIAILREAEAAAWATHAQAFRVLQLLEDGWQEARQSGDTERIARALERVRGQGIEVAALRERAETAARATGRALAHEYATEALRLLQADPARVTVWLHLARARLHWHADLDAAVAAWCLKTRHLDEASEPLTADALAFDLAATVAEADMVPYVTVTFREPAPDFDTTYAHGLPER